MLAAALTLAMVSLAGIPPLAGFFGKFLLIKAVLAQGAAHHSFYWLVGVAVVGVVISLAYYFGVVRAIYWGQTAEERAPITISTPAKTALLACVAGILFIGVYPDPLLKLASTAMLALR